MEARLNTALAPTLPVVFRYNGITKTFSDPPAQGGDAQALGVWKTNDNPPKAWKIYKNLNLQNRITAWYQTAYDQKLPVGGTPAYYQGTYTEGAGAQINGWALVVNWQVGSQFNFQGTKPFGSALRDQQISHSKTSSQYLKILRACEVAVSLPLNDVQGAINGNTSAPEPIVFFDLNIGGGGGQAGEALRIIREWGTLP